MKQTAGMHVVAAHQMIVRTHVEKKRNKAGINLALLRRIEMNKA